MARRKPFLPILFSSLLLFTTFGCTSTNSSIGQPPPPNREFRGVWVATVGNIDWPSKPGLSTADQQKEAIQILDRCVALKLNAVVFQIRTACDAMYDSNYEPWSYFLTGHEGQAPNPYYDPLKFWVEESHKRGLELHAWFNPYRARPGGKYPHAPTHISQTHPELVKQYGEMEWLDPGEPQGLAHTLRVFMDVVERYDIDGVHMDDYFYPYPVFLHPDDKKDKREAPFPDDVSWHRYKDSGGTLSHADWRRENVNQLIYRVYKGIKDRKPLVKFGLSPFGIWKAGYPPVVEGFSQYEKLYADAKLWLNEGWCDYWTPQLYWKLGSVHQPFLPLTQWWNTQNYKHRNLYPGMYTGKVGDSETAWPVDEITGQIQVTRFAGGAHGNVHFSMKTFMENRDGLDDVLRKGLYADDALVPTSPWLDSQPPAPPIAHLQIAPAEYVKQYEPGPTTLPSFPPRPQVTTTTSPSTQEASRGRGRWRRRSSTTQSATSQPAEEPPVRTGVFAVHFEPQGIKPVWQWAVYVKHEEKWTMTVLPGSAREMPVYGFRKSGPALVVAVSAVDRSGNESRRVVLSRMNSIVTPIPAKRSTTLAPAPE